MRSTIRAACCTAFFVICPSLASAIDLYRPVGEQFSDWSCTADTLGEDGGALGLSQKKLVGIGAQCKLTNPVTVRDMNALLYDAECTGEGNEYSERVMVMRSPSGSYIIRDGFVFEWEVCPSQ